MASAYCCASQNQGSRNVLGLQVHMFDTTMMFACAPHLHARQLCVNAHGGRLYTIYTRFSHALFYGN